MHTHTSIAYARCMRTHRSHMRAACARTSIAVRMPNKAMVLILGAQSPRPLGSRLHVQLDNTCGENKIMTVIAFLGWLVYTDVFAEANFFGMPKGHTYTLLDQSFSTLIENLRNYPIYAISALIRKVHILLSGYNVIECRELRCIWDIKSWLEPHVHELRGYATSQFGDGMHEFLIRKDSKGVVRVMLRKTSQASTWLPEGEGYELFKSAPSGSPPFAARKLDRDWERLVVMSTVRRWVPHFVLPEAERRAAEAEWQERLWNMPIDMKVEDLPEAYKLLWPVLPRGCCQAPAEAAGSLFESDTLENPEINPITGPGRSAATVNAELRAFQSAARAEDDARATDGDETLVRRVFQGEYLLMRLASGNGAAVTLHRVAHGIFHQEAADLDATFTKAEYTHAPMPGVAGLWGTFKPALNPDFDSTCKHSLCAQAYSSQRFESITDQGVLRQKVQEGWCAVHQSLISRAASARVPR
eukprot:5852499-Pleurochrysis_carterae.AAC.2